MLQFVNVSQLREEIFKNGLEQYIMVKIGHKEVYMYEHSVRRMRELTEICDVPLTYAWYRERDAEGNIHNHPTIDYQLGAIRDDFDFGSVILLNTADVLNATEDFTSDYDELPDGGWYALRLRLLTGKGALCINEYLYEQDMTDSRLSGEKQHDYVNPRNAEYQKAMEAVCLKHLQEINATVREPHDANVGEAFFPLEASVIIPVRNRVSTVMDAVNSALSQLTDFFNVIVVDNGSTDGTRESLLRSPILALKSYLPKRRRASVSEVVGTRLSFQTVADDSLCSLIRTTSIPVPTLCRELSISSTRKTVRWW